MDFQKFLEKVAGDLDREAGRILKEQLKEAQKIDKKLVPLLKAFIKSCQGGKRIRGALVVLGYELGEKSLIPDVIPARFAGASARRAKAGIQLEKSRSELDPDSLREASIRRDDRKNKNDIIKVAVAYEIMHTAILVHDDIIDESPMRRDKPSLYQALGGNHYGISQAISLADYGFFLAFKILSEANFPQNDKIKALKLFSEVMMDTTRGEMLDLEKTDPFIIMKLKTACYTISGPLQMGALLAGADKKLSGFLGRFGENLGIAYQIRDDILDSEAEYLGSVENAKKEAEKYKNKAMKIIPEITKDLRMSKLLEQMGEYFVQRTK